MNISPGVGLVGAVRYTMRVGPVPSRPVSSAASHRGLCCPDATMSTGLTTAKRFGATAATSAAAKPGGLKAITPCRVACRCQPVWTINRMSVGAWEQVYRTEWPRGREWARLDVDAAVRRLLTTRRRRSIHDPIADRVTW